MGVATRGVRSAPPPPLPPPGTPSPSPPTPRVISIAVTSLMKNPVVFVLQRAEIYGTQLRRACAVPCNYGAKSADYGTYDVRGTAILYYSS
ncbi:hypothetical protein J6590_036834 [Homalodisca vitripennis]|nr:hypothetical protein J6590_036834 [Homalodisca vitripennis]